MGMSYTREHMIPGKTRDLLLGIRTSPRVLSSKEDGQHAFQMMAFLHIHVTPLLFRMMIDISHMLSQDVIPVSSKGVSDLYRLRMFQCCLLFISPFASLFLKMYNIIFLFIRDLSGKLFRSPLISSFPSSIPSILIVFSWAWFSDLLSSAHNFQLSIVLLCVWRYFLDLVFQVSNLVFSGNHMFPLT